MTASIANSFFGQINPLKKTVVRLTASEYTQMTSWYANGISLYTQPVL